MIEAAARREYWVVCSLWKKARPRGAVRLFSSVIMTSGSRNSFQVHMNTSIAIVSRAGRLVGTRIRHRRRQSEAPSSRAASMMLTGTERKKLRIQKTPKARDWAVCGRISAQ